MPSAADNQAATLRCGHCNKDIPASNFTIHEVHCSRFLAACQYCEVYIPISEMKNHFASEHVEVTCECGMKMEKQHLEDHKAFVCLLRLVLCPYCEIQLPLRAMVDHELYCSTRTEECENCHRYILVRDLKEHPRVCGLVGVQTRGSAPSDFEDEDAHLQDLRHSGRESGTDDEPVTLPCQSCGLRYPIYERMDHELVCVLRPAAEDSMPPKAKRQRQESAEPPWTRSKCQGRCMKKEPGPPAEEAQLPRRPRKTATGRNAQLPAPTSRGKARKKAAGKRGRARKRGACERAGSRAGAAPKGEGPAALREQVLLCWEQGRSLSLAHSRLQAAATQQRRQ
ncbi:uncharacterized protein LOC130141532 [Falco biarmicus]|uniref:uncharacterized protein LOC130141532 n=1 Tax=Falco biarmicus TaxID=345155 RepID=UPI0024BD5428|nr:uncharacterized protein LOC130141532 [Falco biarmicus]